MSERACHYCGTTDDLRPYGPGGSWVCHDCAFATPERRAQTEAAFGTLIETSEAVSPVGVAAIGQESGPVPFDPAEMAQPGCPKCGAVLDRRPVTVSVVLQGWETYCPTCGWPDV